MHVQPEVIAQVAASVSPMREAFRPASMPEKVRPYYMIMYHDLLFIATVP
jgi:hypothetical protein